MLFPSFLSLSRPQQRFFNSAHNVSVSSLHLQFQSAAQGACFTITQRCAGSTSFAATFTWVGKRKRPWVGASAATPTYPARQHYTSAMQERGSPFGTQGSMPEFFVA
jgi:hypothetical protein